MLYTRFLGEDIGRNEAKQIAEQAVARKFNNAFDQETQKAYERLFKQTREAVHMNAKPYKQYYETINNFLSK